jgi:Protein of unknown function (DUF2815)
MEVKLRNVRLSFPVLWTAELFDDKATKKRYSASFLIVPGSENDKAVQAAIQTEASAKWKDEAKMKLDEFRSNPIKYCYQRGDLKKYDGYAGMLVLASHRNEDQGHVLVLKKNKTPLAEKDGIPYGGCYVNATVDIWAQDGRHSGVRCTLLGVQFAGDGDPFAAGKPASVDDFDDLSEGAHETAAPTGGANEYV